MKISDAETSIAAHWGKFDREFASAMEQLIQLMLWKFEIESGPFGRCTDGLLPKYEEKTPEAYFGTAVLFFLPDQSVEPVTLDFSFEVEVGKLQAAQIHFGWADERTISGKSGYNEMLASLAAMPRLERKWLWTFTRLRGDWSAQRMVDVRSPLLWPSTP